MNAYIPRGQTLAAVAAALAATLLVGLIIGRCRPGSRARLAAWMLVVASTFGMERLTADEPAGFRMLAIIGALLWSMKGVVSVEAAALGGKPLSIGRWLGFAALWPGMRPGPFARAGAGPSSGGLALMGDGLVRLSAGSALIVAARLVWVRTGSLPLATVLLLPGLSLVLHFGIFNLVAGAWRLAGVDCGPLFKAPLRSTSLGEFWGRRWNLAFSEMTALAVYQPLARHAGRRPAIAAAFLTSGLLHELAISVPVHAGFGLPLLYFALHGGLMRVEDALKHAGRPIDRTPWLGRLWTLGWVGVPLPILFHRPFLARVVWPLIGVRS